MSRVNRALPPGPKIRSSLVFALRRVRDPLEFFTGAVQQYGDLVHLKAGSPDIFLLNDPASIKRVLVTDQDKFTKGQGLKKAKILLGNGLLTSDGPEHRRQRRLVQPGFHHTRIAGYASTMVGYAAKISDEWRDGSTMDISEEMMRLTLAIVAKTLFDADVESEAAGVGQALTAAMKLFPRYLIPFSEFLEKLPLPSNYRFRASKRYLDSMIYRLIEDRRATGEDKGDLLSMLLLAQDDEQDGQRLTDVQVRDEVMTLFLAGYETTSNALTWTWYLVGRNPAVERRLHQEVDSVLAGRRASVEDVTSLSYTEKVFAEAMRLYPPAWVIGRQAIADYEIDGYVIPQGSLVLMSQWVMHRDPRYFPDPLSFNPDRFADNGQSQRPKFSYFPFGGGARVCIGESFAWMEGILLLATIAQGWTLRPLPGVEVRPSPLVTLRPKNGIRVRAERRYGLSDGKTAER